MKVHQIPKDKEYEIKPPMYEDLLDIALEFQSQFKLDFDFYKEIEGKQYKHTYFRWVSFLIEKNLYKQWLLVCQILGVEFHPYMEVEV